MNIRTTAGASESSRPAHSCTDRLLPEVTSQDESLMPDVSGFIHESVKGKVLFSKAISQQSIHAVVESLMDHFILT